ncbi:hypothetical protein E2562_019232 [Oryza meyeriana var. granulata]|uniref:F-box domain-containing protein n=1 Tax=Oryza meyeriana var. granulata TaxID=110450 RepID=A0A6G1FA73_9ORYZ|nr:hypothetical protein E2562_019232 [Oryza meyeriana var. granulata]
MTASALPLRYAAPQLLHRPDAVAVALRLCAHGRRHLVFYVCIKFTHLWLDTYWFCLDALAAAPLLTSGLDATAPALRRDQPLAALWRALTDGLRRRVLADLCAKNGVPLEPTFTSLPGDIIAAILARLADGEDLARVESTCTVLRRLVTERDAMLWKPRYEDLLVQRQIAGVGTNKSPSMSWKERYMATILLPIPITIGSHATTTCFAYLRELELFC